MQSPRVVNGHASSLSSYRDSLINMEVWVGWVHCTTKNTLGAIVIQNWAFVRSRNDLKWSIFLRDVLQKDTKGQHKGSSRELRREAFGLLRINWARLRSSHYC